MAGQHRNLSSARRRGTSIAAYALGLSLVAGGVQPVLAPQQAQQAEAADADRSWVVYRGTTTVRFGETAVAENNVNRLTVFPPVSYALADDVNPGWRATIDPDNGAVSISPDPAKAEDLPDTDTINVLATFKDDSVKTMPVSVKLAGDPFFDPVEDRIFWENKTIKPVHIRAVKVPSDATLTVDDTTLPEGLTVDSSRATGRYQHVYLKGAPTMKGVYEVTAQVEGEDGNPLVGANGDPITQTFIITVNDTADLPAPTEAELATEPEGPVKLGDPVNIPVNTDNAASVEVSGLPDGVSYNEETSTITGTPEKPGDYDVVVDVITEDDKVLQDHVKISVKGPGPSTEPSAEPSTPATSEPSEPTTEPSTEPSTPATTEKPAPTTEPTTQPERPADGYAWDPITVRAGENADAEPVRGSSTSNGVRAADDAPAWVNVDETGRIQAYPPRSLKPGEYTFGVIADDGARSTVTINVTGRATDASRYAPKYRDGFLRAGSPGANRAPLADVTQGDRTYDDQPLPVGTTFALLGDDTGLTIDENTGVITVDTPRDKDFVAKVQVTYPDGTTAKVDAPFVVDPAPQNVTYQPAYEQNKGAQPGKAVFVQQIADVPGDVEYVLADPNADFGGWDISVDLNTGVIRAIAPEQDPKPVTVNIRALYSDGTIDDEGRTGGDPITVQIDALTGPTLADGVQGSKYNPPVYDADGNILIVPTGALPEGATFEVDGMTALPVEVDPESGTIRIKVPADAPANAPFDVPITLTLPDGSTQEIVVPVTTRSEASGKAAAWAPIKLTEGGEPVTQLPTSKPAGTTFALAASFDEPGWQVSIDETTGAITVMNSSGENNALATLIPVVVTFGDGSQRIVEVPATAVRGAAALADVAYGSTDLRAGSNTVLLPSERVGSFSLVTPTPGLGTAIDPATGALTITATPSALPGVREVPVQVLFDDGSTLTISATVNVLTSDGAPTLAKATDLDNMTVTGPAGATTRYALPRPATAVAHPFSLGQNESDGWTFAIDHTTGELMVTVPENAEGQAKTVPVFVEFEDGSRGTFTVTVDTRMDGGSSTSSASSTSSGSSVNTQAIGWIAGLLAVLGLIGAANYALYDNREFFQDFLVWWK